MSKKLIKQPKQLARMITIDTSIHGKGADHEGSNLEHI